MRTFIISMCFASVFLAVGCQPVSVVPANANLNRYSYVAMPPLLGFKETGGATRADSVAIKEYVAKQFKKEGFTVLPDYGSTSTVESEKRTEILWLNFSFQATQGAGVTFSMSLNDATGENVFVCTGKGFGYGTTVLGRISGAIKSAFREFGKHYSGFDTALAASYAQILDDRMKDWERIDIDDKSLREHVDSNIRSIDAIEGIWILDEPGWPRTRMGIIGNSDIPNRDFVEVRLDNSGFYKSGHVVGDIVKASTEGSYILKTKRLDGSEFTFNANVSNNVLEISLIDSNTGESITFHHSKLYPHSIATSQDVAKTSPKVSAQGTCFAVSPKGHIVTAHHVIKDASVITVFVGNSSFVAKLLHEDPINDLAVLKIDWETNVFIEVAPMRSVTTGNRVFTIGFPVTSVLGQSPKYTEGVISSTTGFENTSSFLQITVPVQPGNSGGPLVNEKGGLVGVISSTAAILPFIKETGTLPQNINWAVKADYLRPLIELPKIEQKELTREQIIESVKKSTFIVKSE